jgi:hypothetical protein
MHVIRGAALGLLLGMISGKLLNMIPLAACRMIPRPGPGREPIAAA